MIYFLNVEKYDNDNPYHLISFEFYGSTRNLSIQ